MGNFQNLQVWQLAKELAINIYRLTCSKEFPKDFGYKDQIQRAAVSIPSNISEGDELGSNKQSAHFFYIAKGSVAELLTQIIIGHEIGYISKNQADSLKNDCRIISVMLSKLIKVRTS